MMSVLWRCAVLCLLLGGCSTYELQAPEPGDEKWAPSRSEMTKAGVGEDGSLYRNDYMMTLFQDRRAYRVGDILTVMLEERTQSSKKANTSMNKASSINVPAPSIGGVSRPDWGASVSADRDFDGGTTPADFSKLRNRKT